MSSQLLNSGYQLEYLPSSPTPSRQAYSIGSVSKSPALVPSLAYFPETPRNIENSQPLRVVEKQENRLITFYRSLSWIFGFKDKFSLLLCAYDKTLGAIQLMYRLVFTCGGALLGYCLARAFTMNPSIMVSTEAPRSDIL